MWWLERGRVSSPTLVPLSFRQKPRPQISIHMGFSGNTGDRHQPQSYQETNPLMAFSGCMDKTWPQVATRDTSAWAPEAAKREDISKASGSVPGCICPHGSVLVEISQQSLNSQPKKVLLTRNYSKGQKCSQRHPKHQISFQDLRWGEDWEQCGVW